MSRKRLWTVLKWAAAVVIVAGVGTQFARILSNPALARHDFAFRIHDLAAAGLLYLAAHACFGGFWVRMLWYEGVLAPLTVGLRAYYLSQFGKYIPGKVWVIAIRIALLGSSPRTRLAVGVTATYETLTSMAAGATLGVLFLPWLGVLPEKVSGNEVFLLGMAGLPVLLWALNRLAVRVAARRRAPDAPPLPSPSLALLVQGLLQGAVGWCLLAVSLGVAIRAVVPQPPEWSGEEFLGNLAAVALAYVLGFLVLVAPGGLGVREWLLTVVLTQRFAPALGELAEAQAVVVALVLRLAWSMSEVTLAPLLCAWRPAKPQETSPVVKELADAGER